MRKQFDSCSYDELTYCIKNRIEWLRSYKEMCKSNILKDFPKQKADLRLSAVIQKSEIGRLIKMRRILQKSGLKNWDSDILKDEYIKLYVFRPQGHGKETFMVMAENQELAREYVLSEINKGYCDNGRNYNYLAEGIDGYLCEIYGVSKVAYNDND